MILKTTSLPSFLSMVAPHSLESNFSSVTSNSCNVPFVFNGRSPTLENRSLMSKYDQLYLTGKIIFKFSDVYYAPTLSLILTLSVFSLYSSLKVTFMLKSRPLLQNVNNNYKICLTFQCVCIPTDRLFVMLSLISHPLKYIA